MIEIIAANYTTVDMYDSTLILREIVNNLTVMAL